MSIAQSIFFSTVVMALAIIMASYAPSEAQQRRKGYMVASDGRQFVWRVNTADGSLVFCARLDDSTAEGAVKSRAPYCSKAAIANH